jgi:hypothetical protein
MLTATGIFNILLFISLTPLLSFLPTSSLSLLIPSTRTAVAIYVFACAYLSYSTTKSTSDNEVFILPPSLQCKSSRTSVIILGWGGARRRHLRRLEEWYHSNGITTLSYTAPFSVFFYTSNSKQLQKLAGAALEEASRGQRIIVHLHSNTGAFAFAALLSVCPSLRPVSVIWDSAPGWSPALEPALLKY